MTISADVAVITSHLAFVAGLPCYLTQNCKLEIAWGSPETGPNRAKLFDALDVSAAATFAATVNMQGCNVYVGTTLKRSNAASDRRTSKYDALVATCIAIDIDSDLVLAARKLPLEAQLVVVTGRVPHVRGHIWIGIEPTADLDRWSEITTRAVSVCGGDMDARGKARVMRLAGTISYPTANKQARGYATELVALHVANERSYSLSELTKVLPPVLDVSRQHAPHRPIRRGRRRGARAHPALVVSALAALPPEFAEDHELWIRVGFAIHHFDSGPLGLSLWKQFSSQSPRKAAITDFEYRWSTFGGAQGPRITVAWLLNHARANGWRRKAISTEMH